MFLALSYFIQFVMITLLITHDLTNFRREYQTLLTIFNILILPQNFCVEFMLTLQIQ